VIKEYVQIKQLETNKDNSVMATIEQTFDYWLNEPLPIIIEVAIESIFNEFCFQFITPGLASAKDLSKYYDPSLELSKQLELLQKLQNVLEIYSLLSTNVLSLGFDILRDLTIRLLGYFYDSEFKGDLFIRIKVPQFDSGTRKLVGSFWDRFQPSKWKVKLELENGGEGSCCLEKCEVEGGDLELDGGLPLWKLCCERSRIFTVG
jgi:hypothetical protein